MAQIHLTPAQRKDYRAEAHHLNAVVMIGSDGLTAGVKKEIDAALSAHGLIKVRVQSDDRPGRDAMFRALAEELDAAPIQHIGKLLVLWRPPSEKVKVEKEGRMPGPKVVKVLKFAKSGNHRPQVKKVTVVGNMRLAAGGTLKRARRRHVSIKKSSQQP